MVILPHTMAARRFKEIDRPFDIDPLIKRWLLQAWPNPRACGQVNDLIESYAAQKLINALASVRSPSTNWKAGHCLNLPQIAAFDFGAIKIIQIIECPKLNAPSGASFAHIATR